MSVKIYVGNLPYTCDEEQLRSLFGADGRNVADVAPIGTGWALVQILLIELGIVWIELVSTGLRYGATSESSRSRSTRVGCASAYASACFVPYETPNRASLSTPSALRTESMSSP